MPVVTNAGRACPAGACDVDVAETDSHSEAGGRTRPIYKDVKYIRARTWVTVLTLKPLGGLSGTSSLLAGCLDVPHYAR